MVIVVHKLSALGNTLTYAGGIHARRYINCNFSRSVYDQQARLHYSLRKNMDAIDVK